MLMPTATLPGQDPLQIPTSPIGWYRTLRDERQRIRRRRLGAVADAPARGELLLIKQLVFFERYGKMFLGSQPLIYDPEVYRAPAGAARVRAAAPHSTDRAPSRTGGFGGPSPAARFAGSRGDLGGNADGPAVEAVGEIESAGGSPWPRLVVDAEAARRRQRRSTLR